MKGIEPTRILASLDQDTRTMERTHDFFALIERAKTWDSLTDELLRLFDHFYAYPELFCAYDINMLKAALAVYPWLSARIQARQRRVAHAAGRLHDSRPALRYSQTSC